MFVGTVNNSSKKKKTMFPSVDAMYRDKKRVQEEEEINKLLSNAK